MFRNVFEFPYRKHLYVVMCMLFALFSGYVYVQPIIRKIPPGQFKDTDKWARGKMIWQQNNCHTCHQIYGLGGYLGPDLTNVVSRPGYSEDYLKGIIQSGVKQMPGFALSKTEIDELLYFLRALDETGSAQPSDYQHDGWGVYSIKK